MKHLAIDEIPTSPGPRGSMLGMNEKQIRAVAELSEACVAIGRGGKLDDHVARARAALDVLEREARICLRCGVVALPGDPHGECRAPSTHELRDWLRGPARHWQHAESEVQIGGKKASIEHTARLYENRKTVSVGKGPTSEAAERDALALLPKGKR